MCISSGLSFCRMRRTSCTMDGFCLLYLLMILLVRSGDVETNPGPDRMVSEEEFIELSKLIEPSYYKEVGVKLEIPNAELGQIIVQHLLNTSDALMTVFTRWRDKQPQGTDIRALLAEGLERSNLGSLSGELLAGSLVPNRTGAPVTRPGSQTQSLSPDLIKRCADDFKFKYRTAFCKIRDDPLDPDSIVPFTDMYTNLVLEEEYRKKRKRPLEYSDLFKLEVNGEFPKRIMVQGEAGAGKTTFCAKIAWDWINDSPAVPKFVWVLVVPFREAKQYTIGEIAKSYLSKDNPATACQITEYIRSHPTHVFIAFDGLDEFKGKVVQEGEAGSKSECHQPKSADQTKARSESKMNKNKQQKSMQPKSSSATLQPRVNSAEASGSSSERGDIALTDILHSDELATCPVLVTSRPWKVTEIRDNDSLRKLYTFIHVEGFSKENVEVYIHKYFPEDTVKADQLIQLTKDNVIISKNMAPYPIYIAMLCLMWRELGDEKQEKLKSLQTFSQIFDEMFEFLKVHYAQKNIKDLDSPSFQAYRSRIEKLMEPVAKVAFIGLQENILSFKEGDFEQCSDSIETACRVGVLSQEKKLSSIYDKSNPYLQSTIFFPHKLFQEYMAGAHLASLYELDPNEFNRLIEQVVLHRKKEFRYLLYFTVSRNKAIAKHVMKCMVLQGGTLGREKVNLLVEVSLESQDLDTAVLARGGMLSLTMSPDMTAHTIAGYLFTGLGVHKDVIDLGVNGEFGPIISHDMGKIICSVPSLNYVALRQAALHSDFYAVLAKEGNKSKVHTVQLFGISCPTSASTHYLVDALCSMPNLTRLLLHGKEFKEDFCSTLNAKASTLQVHTVMLWNVRCPTSASSHYLVDALCSMPNLTQLWLRGKEFQEEFYSTLNAKASTLQDSFPQISNGNFMFNGKYQADFDSFLQSLTDSPRRNYVSDEEDNFSDEEDGVSDEEDGVSDEEDGVSDEEDGVSDEEDGVSDEEDGVSEEEDGVSDQEDGVSDQEENVLDEDDNTSDEEDNVSDEKRLGKGDINLVDRKQSSFEVKPLESGASQKFLKFTLDQKPEFTLPYDDMETTRTTAEAQAAWVSTLSQIDLESGRTLPPSDYPQQYVGNTSDTVCQFSQTYREGSSSQSRPLKKKAPSTQSRAPQDDPEIPEKQSNQESRWCPNYTTVDGNQVHCDFLTNSPEELTDALQDDEAVIACGIRFSSSGAKLPEPFKVTLDHNAHFSNPRRAEIIFYTRNKDSNSFERIPASTNGYPRCVVRAKDFDLYVDHFCTWWPVAKIKRYFVGKRVKCTPYVLPPVEKELTHFVLLCIYDDLSDVIQKINEEMTKYTKLHPPQPMFIKWEHGDIVIKMFDGPKENEKKIDKKKLGKGDIHLFAEKLISFEVKPLEPGTRQKFLKFTLNQVESLSDPTSMKFSLPYDDIETARTTAEAQSAGVSTLSQTGLESEGSSSRSRPRKMKAPSTRSRAPQDDSEIPEKQSKIGLVSDGTLNKLSRNMPPENYTMLCTELGIGYTEANGILARFNNDCQRATRHCLAQWKTKTSGNMAQLKTILHDAEVGDLVKHIE